MLAIESDNHGMAREEEHLCLKSHDTRKGYGIHYNDNVAGPYKMLQVPISLKPKVETTLSLWSVSWPKAPCNSSL